MVDGLDWKEFFFIGGGNIDGETINVALTTSRLDIFEINGFAFKCDCRLHERELVMVRETPGGPWVTWKLLLSEETAIQMDSRKVPTRSISVTSFPAPHFVPDGAHETRIHILTLTFSSTLSSSC